MGKNRAKTAAIAERRAKLIDYRRERRPYREFYAELGYSSPYAASRDFNRALEENLAKVRTSIEAYREAALLELDDLAAVALRIMASQHYAVGTGGRVALDPDTGVPLIDHGPNLAAIDRVLRIQDRQAKLLGLDAAQKVEVLTLDALDAEAARLNDLLAAGDREAAEAAGDQAPPG
jgi:Lon protease-like protein